jgi:L-2-hydroxyglutarate oxidase
VADLRELDARAVIACAGLQADRLAGGGHAIVPFRGDYYELRRPELVNGLVYPVPDPAFPFLGVHFTRRVDGALRAGPNAVPALAREGYGRLALRPRDALDVLRHPGFRRLARSYARTGALELWRDLFKPAMLAELRRYVPSIEPGDVAYGPSGIRAQVLARDGSLVDDFLIEDGEGALHVVNAPSPAATASLVIGRHVAERALARFDL